MIDPQTAFNVAYAGYSTNVFADPSYLYRVHNQSFYGQNSRKVEIERHQWRLSLARHHLIAVSKRCPIFPLLLVKSAIELVKFNIFKDNRTKL